jgi:hypothetical protein
VYKSALPTPSSCNRWAAATAGYAQTSVQRSRLTWRRSANTLQWGMSRLAMRLSLASRGCARLIRAISACGVLVSELGVWDGPIVLKGIQSVQDAHAAIDAHVDGIVVSNHSTSLACGEQRSPHLMHHTSLLMAVNNATLRCRSMASCVAFSLAVPLNVLE